MSTSIEESNNKISVEMPAMMGYQFAHDTKDLLFEDGQSPDEERKINHNSSKTITRVITLNK